MKPPDKNPQATATKSAKHSEGFRKRTITPLQFVGAVTSIATEAPSLRKIWVDREMDPGLREKLMVAVARYNEAKYCSWAHHEWAVIEGVSAKELAHIEQMDCTHVDPKTSLAITFVRELIATNFGRVSKARMQRMRARYSEEEIRQITLVAKVMDALNLSSNTFDAFLSRISGKPSRTGRIIDEAIMAAIVCCAFPPFFAFFSRGSNSSIGAVVRRMIEYTTKMDAQSASMKQLRKVTAPLRKQREGLRKPAAGPRRENGQRLARVALAT